MSGPKVVRIVTREEIITLCEGHLQRLESAIARWQAQTTRIGELSETEHAATLARRDRLHAMLADEQFAALQKAVPIEIEFLKRDLAEREARVITRAADERQRQRRLQENASALLLAVAGRPNALPEPLRQSLAAVAQGAPMADTDTLLAQGFAALAPSPTEERLTETQRALAQRLQEGTARPTLAQWLAQQPQDLPRQERLTRIDRHIAELQLLQGAEAAQRFLERLAKAEAQDQPAQRNLLLDSLVLDLAQATRAHQQVREQLERLQDLASEIASLGDETHRDLLQRIADCLASPLPQAVVELTGQCQAALARHLEQQAALARREAVLQGLASLGYEVREGMATAWADTGRVVLRKPATPGYGVEVGGKADNGRLQVRAVALTPDRDSRRDRDIETLWCGEFQRLQALLQADGDELTIERALAIGEVPLKEVALEHNETTAAATRQRSL